MSFILCWSLHCRAPFIRIVYLSLLSLHYSLKLFSLSIWKLLQSCSLDPIPTVLVKKLNPIPAVLVMKCTDILLHHITAIINSSLLTGIFPLQFKRGLVSPIITKKDLDPEILKNYRPITNLSFFWKQQNLLYLISCISIGLYAWMQSAYRPNHSTETALLRVHNDIS